MTTFITILIGFSSFSQSEFAPLGAKWSYHKFRGSDFSGYEYLTISKCDSAYENDGKTIKIVKSDICSQQYHYNQFANQYQYTDRDTIQKIDSFYEQNDTVFAYNRIFEKFTPLYIYNVQEGDTITLPIFDTTYASPNYFQSSFGSYITQFDSTFSFRIDSIKTNNVNGQDVEVYYTSPIISIDWASIPNPYQPDHSVYNTTKLVSTWTHHINFKKIWHPLASNPASDSVWLLAPIGAYVKNIGGLGGGFFPANEVVTNAGLADVSFHFINDLICYKDTAMNLKFKEYACDSFRYNNPLGLKNATSSNQFHIYPNPAQNELHIDVSNAEQNLNIKIVNLLGNEMLRHLNIKQQKNTIDISRLVSGIYIMIVESQGVRYYHKFVKQ